MHAVDQASIRARMVGNALVDAVIGGEEFGVGSAGGTGQAEPTGQVKGVVRAKRRMDWASVLRQCVWPNLVGYFLTGWYLVSPRLLVLARPLFDLSSFWFWCCS